MRRPFAFVQENIFSRDVFRISELIESHNSDLVASKKILNDTKVEPIFWEMSAKNPFFLILRGRSLSLPTVIFSFAYPGVKMDVHFEQKLKMIKSQCQVHFIKVYIRGPQIILHGEKWIRLIRFIPVKLYLYLLRLSFSDLPMFEDK